MKTLAAFMAMLATVACIFVLVMSLIRFCWQQVAVTVFGAPDLTFWQTVGLIILVRFVFSPTTSVPGKKETKK